MDKSQKKKQKKLFNKIKKHGVANSRENFARLKDNLYDVLYLVQSDQELIPQLEIIAKEVSKTGTETFSENDPNYLIDAVKKAVRKNPFNGLDI